MKNIVLRPKKSLTAWEKVSLGSWRINGDSQVYCEIKLSVEKALEYIAEKNKNSTHKITITHFVGAVMGRILKKHPEMNVIIRFSRLFYREQANIFFQVSNGDDLSGACIHNVDQKKMEEIAEELSKAAETSRSNKDQSFMKMKKTWKLIPAWASRPVLNIFQFILFQLNIYVKAFGMPQDPFGGMMITNIGSLGFDNAFVPIVPYSNTASICALGRTKFEACCDDNGNISAKKIVSLCFTFDHRILDGQKGAAISNELRKYFENPNLLD